MQLAIDSKSEGHELATQAKLCFLAEAELCVRKD